MGSHLSPEPAEVPAAGSGVLGRKINTALHLGGSAPPFWGASETAARGDGMVVSPIRGGGQGRHGPVGAAGDSLEKSEEQLLLPPEDRYSSTSSERDPRTFRVMEGEATVARRRNNPVIYEINTWVWLKDLTQRYDRPVTLGTVPEKEWDALQSMGVDIVWFMGVWERSPAGTQLARDDEALRGAYREALPDFSPENDVVGSPYSVRRYAVDECVGGSAGLAAARQALAERSIRLLLDFVPNHLAPDHVWVYEHPEYFIQANGTELATMPRDVFKAGDAIIARGRDPNFYPWLDTAQLNAFNPSVRSALIDVVRGIADQCDGVRCDMPVLVVNESFAKTWGARAGKPPASEFWSDLISAVRETHKEFLFVAEAYWDMEWKLLQQGFDLCYDKRLYDRLAHENAETIRFHLEAPVSFQEKLVRFIENHDEERAASAFGPERSRASAVVMATLPGAKLFHEGQLEGRWIKVPVQLGRRPTEGTDRGLRTFYRRLLKEIDAPVFHCGTWELCERRGWPDNQTYKNLGVWCWHRGTARRLVVVNFSERSSQGIVRLPWNNLAGQTWRLTDAFTGEVYTRKGDALSDTGLYVGLGPWDFHLLRFARP